MYTRDLLIAMDIKIEKDIPVPVGAGRMHGRSIVGSALESLEVGESFLAEEKIRNMAVHESRRRPGVKFTVRRTGVPGQVRIWRIA